jgi:protein-S-isoprenylcysteine O-methyltransferase Ste14
MNDSTQKLRWTWSRIARRIRVPLGFAFAAVYIWLAKPTWTSIAIGCLVAAPGLWLRAIASGHVRKNTELTTTGPYAYTRNPLYLGSIIIALGFGVASRSIWVAVAIIALFFAIYLPVIKSEEAFLRGAFDNFTEYANKVPRLLPRFRAADGAGMGAFSRQLYLKHREYNAVVGSLLMMLALALKLVWNSTNTRGTF